MSKENHTAEPRPSPSLFADGKTVSVPGVDTTNDSCTQTELWPSCAPDRDQLTKKQASVLDTVATSIQPFDGFGAVKAACPTDITESYVRRILKDHWPEAHQAIKNEKEIKESTQGMPAEIFVCVGCEEWFRNKPENWNNCPRCGTGIEQVNAGTWEILNDE